MKQNDNQQAFLSLLGAGLADGIMSTLKGYLFRVKR